MRGLNQPELVRVLRSRKFAGRVSALARYTYETGAEGGLCVYKKPDTGRISVSLPDLPTDEEREEWRLSRNQTLRIYDHTDYETSKGVFDPSRLFCSSTSERRDVALFMHSHPGGQTLLRPSEADLEIYEEQNGFNPNIINGILVATQKRAKIFLYGQTATSLVLGRYQSIDLESLDASRAREVLSEDGFATAKVEFDTVTPKIVSNPDRVASQYFTAKQ